MNATHIIESVPVAQIHVELERVLASEEFENAERMKRFLSYLVIETVEGRSERLKGYNIGVDVFERGDDFDPQLNPIVRVEAGRLRRLLHNYYLGPGDNDPVRISIPKGAYVPSFEHLPTGNGGSHGESADKRSGEGLVSWVGEKAEEKVMLAMPRGPSVAVLPFDNMSADPQQAIFSDGLSEEITTQLARFSTLFVVARHTAFQFRNKNLDVRRIGRDLEVHYVLEGSVRAAGSSVRVTAQLIDATSGLHVWAENYDRQFTADNLIDLQDDIAQSVVATIAEPHGVISRYDLSTAGRRQIHDMDLYTFVLRWFEYTRQFDPALHGGLRGETLHMLHKYPDNSLVWTVHGLLALDEDAFGYDKKPAVEPALDRAVAYLSKAIQLDPANEKAFQYLLVTRYLLGDIEGAFEAGLHALKLNPNDGEIINDYGTFRCYSGDWSRGLEFVQKSMALNPRHSPMAYVPLFFDCYRRGDDEAALRYAEKCDMPGFFWSHTLRAMANGQLDHKTAANTAITALLEQSPDFAAVADAEFRKWLKEESLVQRCLEGLAKAGLVLP